MIPPNVNISISVMGETSDLIEKCSDGSSPSEAHCGGWEGLGKDGGIKTRGWLKQISKICLENRIFII